jgi:DNA-binding NarL/FixJ family response regulator
LRVQILLYNFNFLLQEGLLSLFQKTAFINAKVLKTTPNKDSDQLDLVQDSKILIFQNQDVNESILQTLSYLKTVNKDIKFIALGSEYEKELISALNYTDVFLDAKVKFKTLIKAIEKTISDGVFINPYSVKQYIKLLDNSRQSKPSIITPREIEVLLLICQEKSSKEIGSYLNISSRTVENHRKNLLVKTNSKGTAGLVIFAIRNKLVQL